ncbi:MAG TPA: glycosyltransferase family 4 protein [Fimbriiglobus sp.]|nr:glycosyltransferase family 4 protein [Fimbriiglobus sp.]
MKVAIVNTHVPFVRGGAEYLADSLAGRVRGRGHLVEQVNIPFKWYPPSVVPEHMLACRLLNVGAGEPDLVIALKFPAYLAPFPNKRLWLLHQFRQVYELWGTPMAGMHDTPETRGVRDMVHAADNKYLREVNGLYTNSKIVAGRLRRFNGIEADEVLYPPLDRPELFGPGEFGDYFFYPSRLSQSKRQHIAIEAMRHVRSPIRLVLAGKPDSDSYGAELHRLVEAHGLEHRVTFLGWVTEEEKARWMRGACGAVYLPYDEDSYGYVTLEAFHSHKPLITFTDSGGTNELVEDGLNGLILDPTPEALAAALEDLWANRGKAREMGRAGYETLSQHRIDWEHILDRLLG